MGAHLCLDFAQPKALGTFHWLCENLAENLRNFPLACHSTSGTPLNLSFSAVSWPKNRRIWGGHPTYLPGTFCQYKTWGTCWLAGYWPLLLPWSYTHCRVHIICSKRHPWPVGCLKGAAVTRIETRNSRWLFNANLASVYAGRSLSLPRIWNFWS